jgi:hypothetical protein
MDEREQAYQAAVAEARALDPRSGEERERWKAARRARKTGACAGCARVFAPAEPVWACGFSTEGMFGGAHTVAPVCAECYEQRDSYGWRIYDLAGYSGVLAGWLKGPWPCHYCGRTVHAHTERAAYYCADPCRQASHNERRHVERAAITCPCGRTFTPRRSDAVYCSAACRQRAYRQRDG